VLFIETQFTVDCWGRWKIHGGSHGSVCINFGRHRQSAGLNFHMYVRSDPVIHKVVL